MEIANEIANETIILSFNLILPVMVSLYITVALYIYIVLLHGYKIKSYHIAFIWFVLVTIICMIKGINIENIFNILDYSIENFTYNITDILNRIFSFEPVFWIGGSAIVFNAFYLVHFFMNLIQRRNYDKSKRIRNCK